MAGSKGGKCSKSKGKSKNANKKQPTIVNSKIDLAQTSIEHPSGPIDKDNIPSLSNVVDAVDSSFGVETGLSKLNIDPLGEKAGLVNVPPQLPSQLRENIRRLTDDIRREIGATVIKQQGCPCPGGSLADVDIMTTDFQTLIMGWLERDPNDPNTEVILDLVEEIRDLQEVVKEERERGVQKVLDSARRLGNVLLELNMLRMDVKMESLSYEKIVKSSCTSKFMETEKSLHEVNLQATILAETVKRLEKTNREIRADIEALQLNASESERQWKEVLKRERKYMKKIVDIEKQTSIRQSECEEEKQMVLQMELELLQAEQETKEIEAKWRQESKEKEHMLALLAEETKLANIQKENSRVQLKKLRQKIERDFQLEKDNRRRLEVELSDLQRDQVLNLPEDESIFYNSSEASSSGTDVHFDCMMCFQNEVDVVFLPCKHQVICSACYCQNFQTVGAWCPHCQAKIKEIIKIYGQSS